MKRILISLLLVCIAATIYAQNGTDQYVDFQIVAQDDISTPIYRGPAMVPVQGLYLSLLNTLYLSFAYDLGTATIIIENLYTNESSSVVIPTDSGIQFISIGPDSGLYRIMIITLGEEHYVSELLI